jgi:uncharacterized protein YndB with AHSA1/START domain
MTDTTTAAGTRSLVLERTLAHPPEKIWRALTQAPLIEEWLMKSDFEPQVGHRFTFRAEPAGGWDGVIASQVLDVEPASRLVYRWDSMGLESTVTWTLTPVDGGTHVRMEQAGFRPDQDFAYRGAQYGWTRFLDSLERVVAKLG